MVKIYSRVEQVILWLRPRDKLFNSNGVMIIIEQHSSLALDKLSKLSKKVTSFDYQEVLRSYDPPVLNKIQWFSAFYFYHRGLFRRVWILQEAALAATTRKICSK